MRTHMQKYLSLCALLGIMSTYANEVTPYFTIRSQGFNSVRRLTGQVGRHIYLSDMTSDHGCGPAYGTASLTLEYTRSFRPQQIAKDLFGDALMHGDYLQIQGSQVAGRNPNALLADYFYLPTDFQSSVCFTPRIQNVILDFNYYVGLDNVWKGLYFWVQAPLTWTRWALNISENVSVYGENDDAAGYFTPNPLSRGLLLDNFSEYALGNSPGTLTQTIPGDSTVIPVIPPTSITTQLRGLQFSKMRKQAQKTAVSEVRFALGWNFLLDDDYHLGFNIQASAASGNRPTAAFLFSPQNGNGHHDELGGGINGHYTFWRSEDELKAWMFQFNADITHLFQTHQRRTFDLNDKPLSRYMLAEQMTSDVENLTGGAAFSVPSAQFNNVITPVANITTFEMKVSVGVQADVLAMFTYSCGGWDLDIGYNFWGRSCEKFREEDCNDCDQFQANMWSLKGDAQVYGFEFDATPALIAAVPLSATENSATINGGTNFGVNGVVDSTQILVAQTNPNIDNPQLATTNGTILFTLDDPTIAFVDNPQINTSINPIFIQQSDINYVRVKSYSNKLFMASSYTWEREKWVPYISWGFEVEFAPKRGEHCDDEDECPSASFGDECNNQGDCIRCGLSQWGVWLKGGLSYQ